MARDATGSTVSGERENRESGTGRLLAHKSLPRRQKEQETSSSHGTGLLLTNRPLSFGPFSSDATLFINTLCFVQAEKFRAGSE